MIPAEDEIAYERAWRALLWRFQPRRLQRGVEWLMQRTFSPRTSSALSLEALQRDYERTREQAICHLVRRRVLRRRSLTAAPISSPSRLVRQTGAVLEHGILHAPTREGADFHCDSGLGRLARWLRAAGYDARFWPAIDDSELIRLTLNSPAILLTTDAPLMRRSAVTWGVIPALLVPLNLAKNGQFQFVTQRLSLPRKSPRCMACGGPLVAVQKESVRDRIPERTYPWLDEYFECGRCGKLFWPGTHWQNVTRQLGELRVES